MIRTDTVPAYSRILVTLLATAVLAACGPSNPGTKGGSQAHTAPTAAITPIGYAPAPDGTITVRSGALVVLSGKDSVTVDDPILSYAWTPPVDPTTQQDVPFLTNTSNSITFFAPNVPAGAQGTGLAQVTMQVGLKVTTASGLTSITNYTVHVVRASDEDDFLLSDVLATRDKVQVKIVAAAGGSGSTLAADVPFTIHVNRHVLYRLRGDVSGGPVGGDQVVERRDLAGQWLSDYGIVGGVDPANPVASLAAAQAAANPRFVLRPPILSDVDVNLAAATATGAVPSTAVFDVSAVNDAEAEYEVTLSLAPGAATPNVPLALVALTRNGAGEQFLSAAVASAPGAPVTLLLRRSDILAATTLAGGGVNKVSVIEDAASALAYVQALDPLGVKDTLDKWMRDNCFDPAATDLGGDIHAVYTNNFDLGFGRDMHFKTNCTTAQRSALGATINTAGGERAAVVVNYPTLESAAKHVGGFLAVAMEYRLPPCLGSQGSACSTGPIVSFWTFAQDPASGVWKRVISADFDGRGQHYTPGNCTVCHGGRPKATLDYANTNADLGAMFLPWDSKALLFSDVGSDPSFKDDAVRAPYLKAAQLPNIRALNLAMASTLATDLTNCGADCTAINANRKVLRDLATGWGNGSIAEDYVPDVWAGAASSQPQPCGAAGQPPCVSPAQLYKDVIAQYCRACHLQRVAEPAIDGTLALADAPNFADYTYFTGSKSRAILQDRVFTHGVMPASRLTADRFWLGGAASPASELANHLGLPDTSAALGPVASIAAIDNAGAPLTVVTDPVAGPVTVAAPDTAVRLTARDSAFASSYNWAVTPSPNPAVTTPRLAGALDMEPGFVATTFGTFPVTLTVTDATGLQSAQSSLTIAVNSKPTAPAHLNTQLALVNGVYTTSIDLLNPPSGNVAAATLGDGINIVSLAAQPPGYATVAGTPGQSRACPAAGQSYYDPACVAMCLSSDVSCALTISSPVTVNVSYQITDESPPPLPRDAAPGNITATNPVNFQAGSGSATVTSWRPGTAGATLDLDNTAGLTGPHQAMRDAFGAIVDTAGWTYRLTISVPPAAVGRSGSFDANSSALACAGGTTGSAVAAASGGVVTYTPPPYFVSSQGSASGGCNGGTPATDSFRYTISAYDAGNNLLATSSEGTITLTVGATTTYATVFNQVLNAKCSACHGSTPPAGANWATATRTRSFVDLPAPQGVPPLGLASAGCPDNTPSSVASGSITETPTPHCIELGAPGGASPVDTSLLYTKPLGANHGGGKVLDPVTNATLLQLIRDWLLDGAYNN
jgi:hypothetical protein